MATNAAAVPPANQPKTKSPLGKILAIVFGVFALIILALVLFFVFIFKTVGDAAKEPVNLTTSFIEDIRQGDTDGAYEAASTEFKEATSKEDLDEIIDQTWTNLPDEEPSFSTKQISGSDEGATANLEGKVGNVKFTASLIVENGKWRLQSFETSAE